MPLRDELRSFALDELGFARVGVARAERLAQDSERLGSWLAAGCHGEMGYMERTADERADPCHVNVAPFTRSVIVMALPYGIGRYRVGPDPGRVARYAWGRDYHNVIGRKLRRLVKFLEQRGFRARPAVDTKPVLERAWAVRAGLGFIGKNTCLIIPGLGSHVLLGVVMTDAELSPDEPQSEGCGACTACLDSCPSSALPEPRFLDARRCISYLSIESKSPIPEDLRPAFGDWVFGCDLCQDVCPYNQGKGGRESREPFVAHARWKEHDACSVMRLDDENFARFAEGSPLRRAGRVGFLRNVAVALGNVGDRRHLPVLQDASCNDESEIVREASHWAYRRIAKKFPATANRLPDDK